VYASFAHSQSAQLLSKQHGTAADAAAGQGTGGIHTHEAVELWECSDLKLLMPLLLLLLLLLFVLLCRDWSTAVQQ
jgi:hypothetical protein